MGMSKINGGLMSHSVTQFWLFEILLTIIVNLIFAFDKLVNNLQSFAKWNHLALTGIKLLKTTMLFSGLKG